MFASSLLVAHAALGAPAQASDILEKLEAANRARLERGQVEEARRRDVLDLGGRAARARVDAAADRARARDLRQAYARLREATAPLVDEKARLTAVMLEAAEVVHARLDALARTAPPSAVPPRPEPEPSRPDARLEAALDRLDETERRARSVEVVIAEGQLDGERVAVEVLRFGAAMAWWIALDGTRGGWLQRVDGATKLRPVADPRPIARAVTIAKGRQSPSIVLLPWPKDGS